MRNTLWLLGCLAACGCGARFNFEDGETAPPLEETGQGGETSGDGAGGGAGEPSAGGQGGEGSECDLVPFSATAEADTVIFPGSCDGANYAGMQAYANVGAGRGLFRFVLDADLAAAFDSGRVVELGIALARDFECLGAGSSCPAAEGSLAAHPVRNDWEEGPDPFVPYMGADWCRRGAGQTGASWEQAGAGGADSGAASGGATVDAVQPDVDIALAPDAHLPFIDGASLSVLLVAEAGAVFVAATREQPEPAEPPAELHGTYCAIE